MPRQRRACSAKSATLSMRASSSVSHSSSTNTTAPCRAANSRASVVLPEAALPQMKCNVAIANA
jgi:hypothetical protein